MAINSRKNLLPEAGAKRPKRPKKNKYIIISAEGTKTEEEYFSLLTNLLNTERVKFISARDFGGKDKEELSQEKIDEYERPDPKSVLQRLIDFKRNNQDKLMLRDGDEYWLVLDVDHHTKGNHMKNFIEVIKIDAPANKFNSAVSNPRFELWRYLHHHELTQDDHDNCSRKDYFEKRINDITSEEGLREGKKNIHVNNYTIEKIRAAAQRAKDLHKDKDELYPMGLGTHVYLLVQNALEILDE